MCLMSTPHQASGPTNVTSLTVGGPSSSYPTCSSTWGTMSHKSSDSRTGLSTATSAARDSPPRVVWGRTRARWAQRPLADGEQEMWEPCKMWMLAEAGNSIPMTIKLLFVFTFALFAVEHGKFDRSREFQLLIKLWGVQDPPGPGRPQGQFI